MLNYNSSKCDRWRQMENKGADRKSKHSKSHAWFTKHNFLQLGKEIGYSIKKEKE